jgi:peptidoglycan/xylan/chitin deacetylase (PgdA/CDA1 family)
MSNQFDNGRSQAQIPIFFVIIVGAIILAGTFYAISRLTFSDSSMAVPVTAVVPTLMPEAFLTPTLAVYGIGPVPAQETVVPQTKPTQSVAPTESFLASYQLLPPLPAEKRGLIFSGDRTEPVVALTFDVGETADLPAGFDRGIINVLNETQTPATFFLGGLWMVNNEAETRELAANPLFELGNHAWSHLDFAQITPEEMTTEIVLTQQKMWDLFGWQTILFRLPFGTYTEQSLGVIADHGMLTIQWDVVSGDPDPNILAEPMADWVIQQVQPGSIIIMHANGRGWHTAEALPEIISTLRAEGYTFVTISDLLNLETPQTPLHGSG